MGNYDWVAQPPQAPQYTFLVDQLNPEASFGRTTELDKINYNRKLMGVNFNMEVGVNTALSQEEVLAVLPLGRYVTIFQISANELAGAMTFVDYQIKLSPTELAAVLSSVFPADIVQACLDLQSLLATDFSPADDIVRLEQV